VIPERPANLTLMVRIPGWAQGRPFPSDLYMYAGETRDRPVVRVNDEIVTSSPERGYIPVTRTWQKGDRVEVSLPMAVRRVLANSNIAADEGRVAVERGPFVYCAEWTDNNGYASNLVLDDAAVLAAEWVQYDFEEPITISETAVYWFDDTGEGECRVPVSWKAFYRSGESWVPVKTEGPFGVARDTFNTVQFAPVKTTALRLLIQMPESFSSGILEWKVK
jgi:DUF1680 family protein